MRSNIHLALCWSSFLICETTAALLDVFQVEAPVRSSYEGAACQQAILQHEFAFSYGSPYVGIYSPPKDCTFTTTVFNLSVVSAGINYDRLGLLFFGDIEIWRTSTAMPTRTGIYWNFQKDMTIFDTLLRSEQKVIMELDNLYDSIFTAAYNVTIEALYYNDPVAVTAANLIFPISAQLSAENKSSILSLPDGNATVSFTFPRNVERSVVSILASGNGAEEFWYTNVPTEYDDTFNNTAIYGYSPFREVQLLVDGELAGVSWPFPIVFTGGISPGLWVPIVGIDAYDLPSFEIDVSPWLGTLCDGHPHSFELKVVGYDSETTFGTVGSNWWISGAIFVWLDDHGNQTTGTAIESFTPSPVFTLAPHVTSDGTTNTSLWIELSANRLLSHTSIITTSFGPQAFTWTQGLSYHNIQNYTAAGFNLSLSQITTGTSTFSLNGKFLPPIKNSYRYPIDFYQAYTDPADAETTNSSLLAFLDRSKLTSSVPILSYLTSPSTYHTPEILATRQNGSCIYYWNNTYYEFAGAIDPAMGTIGATEQWFSYAGPGDDGKEEEYGRHVKAFDGYEPVLVVNDTFGTTIYVPPTEKVPMEEL